MKVKKAKLEWYVLRWNNNKSNRRVEEYNILHNLVEDIAKEVRAGHVYNKSILREYLKTELMWRYWSKTECEFYISDLHGDNYEKVDMWRQIYPNLDNIVNYINEEMELKF